MKQRLTAIDVDYIEEKEVLRLDVCTNCYGLQRETLVERIEEDWRFQHVLRMPEGRWSKNKYSVETSMTKEKEIRICFGMNELGMLWKNNTGKIQEFREEKQVLK